MSSTRGDTFRNELRKLLRGVSRLFHEDPAPGATGEEGARQPLVEPSLTIREVMQKEPSTVRPESLLGPAVSLMMELEVSSLPVVDVEGRIVGALNQRDVLKVFYEREATTVGSVMTLNPIVMSVGAPLVDVIDQLMSSDFRRVLVHEDGRLVGVIVRTHLLPIVRLTIEELAARGAPTRGSSH
jgi:CBS domain-containing protein